MPFGDTRGFEVSVYQPDGSVRYESTISILGSVYPKLRKEVTAMAERAVILMEDYGRNNFRDTLFPGCDIFIEGRNIYKGDATVPRRLKVAIAKMIICQIAISCCQKQLEGIGPKQTMNLIEGITLFEFSYRQGNLATRPDDIGEGLVVNLNEESRGTHSGLYEGNGRDHPALLFQYATMLYDFSKETALEFRTGIEMAWFFRGVRSAELILGRPYRIVYHTLMRYVFGYLRQADILPADMGERPDFASFYVRGFFPIEEEGYYSEYTWRDFEQEFGQEHP